MGDKMKPPVDELLGDPNQLQSFEGMSCTPERR